MEQKVSYNKKIKNNKIKKTLLIILSLFVIFICIKSVKNVIKELQNEKQPESNKALVYSYVSDYNTLEELVNHYDCKFISKEESDEFIKIYLLFNIDLYTGEKSNENYFWNFARVLAEFLKYKNFELVDETKKIDIEVKCENTNIVEFKINGDINYYLNNNSARNKGLSTNITNYTIQSPEFQQLIEGKWNELNVNWGTKESVCKGYNIYFDEGIKYKNVARNIYNVIFTTKYSKQIAGGLNAKSSKEEVEKALGEPTFKKDDNLYGYKSNDAYVFFDFLNEEVSVYPVQNIESADEKSLKNQINSMNESSDIKTFVTNLTNMWIDYDVYDYDSNYVDLEYTLRGIKLNISSSSLKNGIYIYTNYEGNTNISDLDNVYLMNTDLVFEAESLRSTGERLCRAQEGDYPEDVPFGSKKFSAIEDDSKYDMNELVYAKGINFYSKDKTYPDSELERNLEISSYFWYNDSCFLYAVNNEGIYLYNCETRINQKVLNLNENVKLNSLNGNELVYNDNQKILLNLE